VKTPQIDALANEGIIFTRAVTDAPWSRGAMASVLTGRYASAHGVQSPYQRLADGLPTLAEAFRDAGYRTAAVVDSFDVDHIFRLNRGFEVYDDRFDEPIVGSSKRALRLASIFYGDVAQDHAFRRRKLRNNGMRSDEHTTEAAVSWLRRVGAQRFFLWVHYFGARERWRPGVSTEEQIAAYPARVAHADAVVGGLLKAIDDLGLTRNTVVVLHADHGRPLGRPGFLPGVDLHDSSIRVPLIVRWPPRLSPRRIDTLVRLIDLSPTLAELAGLSVPRNLDGQSLVGVLQGADTRRDPEAYAETYVPPSALAGQGGDVGGERMDVGFVGHALRTTQWKYIRNEPIVLPDQSEPNARPPLSTTEELYDLTRDPEEATNLIDEERAVAAALRVRLAQYHPSPAP